jgi:putative ABC transport system ATP-binding protein
MPNLPSIQQDQLDQRGITDSSERIAVQCCGVVKEFGKGQTVARVLHGIDLEVFYGDITFLVGPSGCGKTTLISIVAGLLNPTEGSVNVLGRDVSAMRGGALVDFRSKNLGFIFQQFNLLPALTAAENAAVPLIGQGMSFAQAVRQASEMLGRLDMGKHTRKYPNQLSGGQQQRVAVARSLVHSPSLIICDEPTASLDATTGQSVMEMLRTLAAGSDRAIIVVTHDNRIFSFADRIAHIADGRISHIDVATAASITRNAGEHA